MKKVFFFILIYLLGIIIYPATIHAQEKGIIYYYTFDNENEFIENFQEIDLDKNKTVSDKAKDLYVELFKTAKTNTYIPEGLEVIWVNVSDGVMILNLSKEAYYYSGNFRQDLFIKQIAKTAYSLDEIRSIILYVEGKESDGLSEGYDLSIYTRDYFQ